MFNQILMQVGLLRSPPAACDFHYITIYHVHFNYSNILITQTARLVILISHAVTSFLTVPIRPNDLVLVTKLSHQSVVNFSNQDQHIIEDPVTICVHCCPFS